VTILQLERTGLSPEGIESLKNRVLVSTDPDHFSLQPFVQAGLQIYQYQPEFASTEAVLIVPVLAGPIDELVSIVDRLLGPGGCPWDQAQTHDTLKKYLLEEAYEVIDAIEASDTVSLCEELGDLILQPVMHGQISAASGGFSTNDCAKAINRKLIHRHPHVFGDASASSPEDVLRQWDLLKMKEKEVKGETRSILSGVPRSMAALHRAYEVSKRAARVGFEWSSLDGVLEKMREEIGELLEAQETGDQEHIKAEVGDLLFTVVNIARWLKVEPEEALRRMVDRFTERFQTMEALATTELTELREDQWESLWQAAKRLTIKPQV